jgi:hypothetical protein
MQRVTEEEAKKWRFVGARMRPARHKADNKRGAREEQKGTHEQPWTWRAAFGAINIFAHS